MLLGAAPALVEVEQPLVQSVFSRELNATVEGGVDLEARS